MSRLLPALWMLLAACAPSAGTVVTDHTHPPSDVPPAQAPVSTAELGPMADVALTANPPGALFDGAVDVTLSVTVPIGYDPDDIAIWYTTNGLPPTIGSTLEYTGPITLTSSTQIRAIAEVDGQLLGIAPTFVRLDNIIVGWSSDLPIVTLWTPGTAPVDKSEDYTTFALNVFEPDATGRVTFPTDASLSVRAGLKVRGSSSAGAPKKPYRLETWHPTQPINADQDVSLLGMPSESDWVLLAPLTHDRALMRNALIYQLSNDVGRYAPRTRFAEVFVVDNRGSLGPDDYVGVYVVMERIERDNNRVPITQLLPTDVSLPELSGGYLFKEDRPGPDETGFYAGTAGGAFYFQQPFVSTDPSEAAMAPEQADYLAALLDELGDALASPTFTNPTTGRHYNQIIDVDSFIDNHILNVFTKNPDAFRLSGYFHKDRNGLVQAGPIWDFDRTMGCTEDDRAIDPTWWDNGNVTTDCTFVFEHGFWGGLFSDPAFTDRYWLRWQVLLDNELSVASVHAHIDAMEAELAEAAPRNFNHWPTFPPRGGSLSSEVDLLKDWIASRHDWMSFCLNQPDPSTCAGL